MSNLVKQSGDKYFLEPDTEITKEQYDAINAAEQPVSGDIGEANILRLHEEQDAASPLFKGSEPINTRVSGTADGEAQPTSAYYEPTADKVDPIADEIPEPEGTTTITTEQATIPPTIEENPASEVESETPESTEDESNTGAQ